MVIENMKVPFVDLSRQFSKYQSEYEEIFRSICISGQFVMGPQVEEFEKKLAEFCGVNHAITVGNGTDSMILILKSLNIGEGDEVITAPNSFIASAGAIEASGAKTVFCDVNEDLNINPKIIGEKITQNTKAIIPVHLTGRSAKMDEINAIACSHELYVIEDAAQAIGAEYKGKKTGSMGFAGSFSLHPLKNLNVFGDGGFVTTNDEILAKRLKRLRNHGLENRDSCTEWGYNSRLDTLQAGIGLFNLTKLDEWNARFRDIARMYSTGLAQNITVPQENDFEHNVYHNYVINVHERDNLIDYLLERGIETKIHYPILLHKQKSWTKNSSISQSFPLAEELNKTMLSLPIYPFLRNEEVEYVIDNVNKFYT